MDHFCCVRSETIQLEISGGPFFLASFVFYNKIEVLYLFNAWYIHLILQYVIKYPSRACSDNACTSVNDMYPRYRHKTRNFELWFIPMTFLNILLCLIIIIKSEVWTIIHCLGLVHETMVCAVCLFILLFLHRMAGQLDTSLDNDNDMSGLALSNNLIQYRLFYVCVCSLLHLLNHSSFSIYDYILELDATVTLFYAEAYWELDLWMVLWYSLSVDIISINLFKLAKPGTPSGWF